MKKLLIFFIILFCIGASNIVVKAETANKHNFKGSEQTFDHFMLDQFNDEIQHAMKEYYKKDTIRAQYNWWNKTQDVVEIEQCEKGNDLSHPYIIKFTIDTYDGNKNGQLGTDTITFGVSPISFNEEMEKKDLSASKVILINYKHSKPTK